MYRYVYKNLFEEIVFPKEKYFSSVTLSASHSVHVTIS